MTERNLTATLAVCSMLSAVPFFASAQQTASPNTNGITVENAWSRAARSGSTAAVYLTITDSGAPDRLVSIATPLAETAEIHESFAEKGVMKMRPAGPLLVAPGKPLTLEPGHYHAMLTGLRRPTSKGDSFPLTLTFEQAPAVTVQVHVESAGGRSPDMSASHHGMDMPSDHPGGRSHP